MSVSMSVSIDVVNSRGGSESVRAIMHMILQSNQGIEKQE